MASEINKFRKKAAALGFDIGPALDEVKADILAAIPKVDEESVAIKAASKVAGQFAELKSQMDSLQAAIAALPSGNLGDARQVAEAAAKLVTIDIKAVGDYTAQQLQPLVVQQIKQSVEEARQKTKAEVMAEVDSRAVSTTSLNPTAPGKDGQASEGIPPSGPGTWFALIDHIFQNILGPGVDAFVKIKQASTPSAETRASDLVAAAFRLSDKIDRLKSGQASVQSIGEEIGNIIGKKPETPK